MSALEELLDEGNRMTMKDDEGREVRCSMCDKVFAGQASKDRHLYRCPAERKRSHAYYHSGKTKLRCANRVRCKTAGDTWRRLRCGRVQKDGGHVLCDPCANRRAHVAAHAKLAKRVRTSPGTDPKNTLPRSDGPKGRATPAAPQGARAVDGPLNLAPRPLPERVPDYPILVQAHDWKRLHAGTYVSHDARWFICRTADGERWLIQNPVMGLYSGPVTKLIFAKTRVERLTACLMAWTVEKRG